MDTLQERGEPYSAVTWAAVFAGAVVSLALGFLLLSCAAGFGLDIGSPWPSQNPSLAWFSPQSGAALVAAQAICGAFGGYLAGRLRIKWLHVHGHEVHFRDTAHGLLSWAVSTIAGGLIAGLIWTSHPIIPALPVSADVTAQYWLFMTIGLLLGAFASSVAAAIGGMRRDHMHDHYWSERTAP